MTRNKDVIVYGLAVVLASVMVYRVQGYLRVYDVQAGDKAPAFLLEDDRGLGVSLQDYDGKVVLLNFWATWCPPCIYEMPSLNTLYERYRGQGFIVLGISVDEDQEQYESFLNQSNISFPTVRDPERSISARYGTLKYPESYLISRDGRVLRKYMGPEDWIQPEIVNYLGSVL